MTAKNDERALWENYCRETGRYDDLIIIEPGGFNSFNFLDYEARRKGDGSGLVENLVLTLKTVIKAKENEKSGTNEAFWDDALDMLLFNIIDLCLLAYGELNIDDIDAIAETLPKEQA